MLSIENVSPIMWETEKEMNSTADISQLLDLLPDPSAGSTTVMSENCLADLPITIPLAGAESNESSSGSGTSSPQYGVVSDDHSSARTSAVQPDRVDFAIDDLDMWDMLQAIDGPQANPLGNPLVSTPETPAAFERHTACVSPNAWAAAAECLQPTTPLKPQSSSKAATKPKGERSKSASKAAAKPRAAPAAAAARAAPSSPGSAAGPPPSPVGACSADGASKLKPKLAVPSARSSESGEDTMDAPDSNADDDAMPAASDAAAAGDDGTAESAEDKRLKRMRRNRESAAMSRNRKKQYVEELEAQVQALNETVRNLQAENFDLRRDCARARGTGTTSPPLPLPSPPTLVGSSSTAMRPPLPEPALPDLALLEDLVEPEPIRATQKRAGSPLLGGATKRVSAASLALMSAVTFVTLSMGGRTSMGDELVAPSVAHAPGARMLMSLDEPSPFASLFGRDKGVPSPVDESMLWPSLNLEQPSAMATTYSDPTSMLPPPRVEATAPPPTAQMPTAAPRGYAERVIRAPQNSSWADVLRIEAAEKQMAEAQMALHALKLQHSRSSAVEHSQGEPAAADSAADAKALALPRAKTAYQMQEPVFDATKPDEAALYDDFDPHSADAERYIFCSRAYMFDAIRHPAASGQVSRRHSKPGPGPTDLELPATMPERFRYTADRASRQELPALTDGENTSSSARASDPSLHLPVVNLLLPSAALRGVSGVHAADEDDKQAHASGNGRNELMQVQCQVLNASRFS